MPTQLKYRTCNLCEALCGLEIEVEDNSVVSIRGDKEDVFSRGHLCPKAVALKDIHEDPDRLTRPVQKVNGEWQSISWKDAYIKIAERITDIQDMYGHDAVGIYQGNPSVHNLGTSLFSPLFVRALKTRNRFSATSVDQLGHHLAGEFMFGHMNLMPVPDIDRTDYWLILGGNPLVSNGSIMTAPNVAGRLKKIQKRGGMVTVVDPRRTETAVKADKHLFIRPGTDLYLLLWLIRSVFDGKKLSLNHLEACIDKSHIAMVQGMLNNLQVDDVSRITGIGQDDLKGLAKEFLAANRAVCYGRLGISAAMNGGLNHWAINFLNIISGNFDRPGGAMLPNPAVPVSNRKSKQKRFARWRSRVRQLPETGGELPASVMAEEILTPGDGQIKAMIISCGNPVLSTPNGRQLDKAFDQLEFMLAIDIYINETSQHADFILPPATGLETPHYGLAFHNLAIRNTAKYSDAVLPKKKHARYDWEIYQALTTALEEARGIKKAAKPLTPEFMIDQGLRMGQVGLDLSTLKAHPHGIDLGSLKQSFPHRLMNENHQIDLFPEIYRGALRESLEKLPLHDKMLLIGRRNLRSNNSWLHNSQRMVKGPNKCTALIHPDDAQRLAITEGQLVEVKSKVGQITLPAELTTDMLSGVISIPHGWGHDRPGVALHIAGEHAGVSFNDLVDDQEADPLTGVAIITAVPVEVSPVD